MAAVEDEEECRVTNIDEDTRSVCTEVLFTVTPLIITVETIDTVPEHSMWVQEII